MSEALASLQEGLVFGSGDYLGLLLNQRYNEFASLSARDQALLVGYADGCPVAQRLTDPANSDQDRGPENMVNRYGEVNYWFRHIVHTAEALNPELAAELTLSVSRSEPSGESFESDSVPNTFYSEMSPLGTLWGYAASRILVKQIGSDSLPRLESQRRLDVGLSILERSVREAETREDLLAIMAQGVADAGDVTETEVLHEVLSAGWYGEHHATGTVEAVKDSLRLKSQKLWSFYESLPEDESAKAGILLETPVFETAAGPISVTGIAPYHNDEFGYTLWEDVIDPANPEGPKGIVMHVPAGMMSKAWKLLETDYQESIEVLRGDGSFVYQRDGDATWATAPLDAAHPTADDIRTGKGDAFCVVAGRDGIVVFSRPSKEFHISFEKGLTNTPHDALSIRILANIALSKMIADLAKE